MNAKPELTKHEARAILADVAWAYRCGVRNVSVQVDCDLDVVYWCADVFNPELDPDDDLVAHVGFNEHYPEPDITWL